MGNTSEITLEEALKMLAAAKLQIEEQQQQLKTKDDVILEKDLKIDSQIAIKFIISSSVNQFLEMQVSITKEIIA